MVTVVDAYNFLKDFGSPERLVDRKLSDIEEMTEQLLIY